MSIKNNVYGKKVGDWNFIDFLLAYTICRSAYNLLNKLLEVIFNAYF